jgi:hypothetical protein
VRAAIDGTVTAPKSARLSLGRRLFAGLEELILRPKMVVKTIAFVSVATVFGNIP